jgi:hypothetical protein
MALTKILEGTGHFWLQGWFSVRPDTNGRAETYLGCVIRIKLTLCLLNDSILDHIGPTIALAAV